jgi:hypothetical protein
MQCTLSNKAAQQRTYITWFLRSDCSTIFANGDFLLAGMYEKMIKSMVLYCAVAVSGSGSIRLGGYFLA